MVDHGKNCGGIWCITGGNRVREFRHASCGRCGLAVFSMAVWREIDPEAFAQAVDPDGVQRQFMRPVPPPNDLRVRVLGCGAGFLSIGSDRPPKLYPPHNTVAAYQSAGRGAGRPAVAGPPCERSRTPIVDSDKRW